MRNADAVFVEIWKNEIIITYSTQISRQSCMVMISLIYRNTQLRVTNITEKEKISRKVIWHSKVNV